MSVGLLERSRVEGPITADVLLAEISRRLVDCPLQEKFTFKEWLQEYYFIDGAQLSFEGWEPIEQVWYESHPDMVIMKSAQCRVSEYLVAYSFYFPLQYEENVFYAMPAKDQIKDFVQGRVDPRIDDSPRLQELIRKTDNTGLKQVGLNFIYFRGSQNTRQIKTVDAGLLIRDEFDEMIQSHISIMEKRLGNSEYKIKKDASTPTYFEYGIHLEYLNSDQHEYFIKCDKCGKWQTPDWSKNIRPAPTRDKSAPIPKKVELVCADCGTPLNREQKGEWRAQNPGALRRGYHISKLIFRATDLLALWIEFRDTRNIQDFYNSNLGLPYAAEGGKLDDQMLNACRQDFKVDKPINCSMGVDVGDVLHVRVSMRNGHKKQSLFIGTVKNFEDLDQLIKRFDVWTCVIDGLPETRKATEFANRHPGRVYLAYYQLNDPNKTFELKRSERPMKVNINRNRAMDETGNRFIERNTVLPMNANEIPGFYDQLKAPQKVKQTDANGNEVYRFMEGNKADHYFHAEVYDDIADQNRKNYEVFAV